MKCAIVPKDRVESVLKELNKRGMVDREFRITKKNGSIIIPLVGESTFGFHCEDCNPPLRVAGMSPLRRIELDLSSKGISPANMPEHWIRYGDSLILRLEGMDESLVAGEFINVLGVKSVYKLTGGIEGDFRTPSVKLVMGPGGETVHLENGIRFVFDPEKIMFSPGNVNERVSVSALKLTGKSVLDMFCGIGYFTLPIAKYSGTSEIIAVDINPEAIRYLKASAKKNRVQDRIKAVTGDSFTLDFDRKFDLVVMGNFRSTELLGKALSLTAEKGRVILHHLVRKEELETYRNSILQLCRDSGHSTVISESHCVKSYSPNVWHYSTMIQKQ